MQKLGGPPKMGKRPRWLRVLIAATVAAVGLIVASQIYKASNAVPSCDAKVVIGAAREVSAQLLSLPLVNDPTASFGNIEEVGYDAVSETRMCEATFALKSGDSEVAYTVSWTDKVKGQFRVNVRIK